MPSRVSKRQVQAVERRVALLEAIDDAQALQVVLEAAVLGACSRAARPGRRGRTACGRGRAPARSPRPGLRSARSAARDRAADLRHFERVRQARAEQVALVVDEDLGLVDEAAERGAVHDAVAVALVFAAWRRRLGERVRAPRGSRHGARHRWRTRASAQPAAGGQRLAHAAQSGSARARAGAAERLDQRRSGSRRLRPSCRRASARASARPSSRGAVTAGRRARRAGASASTKAGGISPEALRQVGRHHHAAADRLAVQPLAVAQAGLDRVAEGVAEVEDGAQAALALVLAHDVRP